MIDVATEDISLVFEIDEDLCINCGSCRRHCPFDAIEYSMHHRILSDPCTGCTLCFAVCPVPDCITPVPIDAEIPGINKIDSLRTSLLKNNSYWVQRTLLPEIKQRAGLYLLEIVEQINDQ